ncbi:energy-coupling factor transporter ATP-binding protein EcfA2 [Microbacteriaceae bacterium SG_E_30_P1]|uniref:Energy-coupling factor transporter ATP-binding protein EcfA2 n=1 Tax=Antiquaquibacter oligotrophicus TaxID=2880260 RepID=A0ABT6KQQ3_9MICO|nr:dynamin family protein [Antiquaquibacter oligotrophicus]MDH6182313.1 energy-coupling factor transporter ATP-binding protein EcfA2 [Antiquaquibacter oligotrophicus]UDF12032.1 dynamin family protein [Antiquaquibacter oligotrophicus]
MTSASGALARLDAVRTTLEGVSLPLPLEGALEGRAAAAAAVRQIDDYIRPRLTDLDAPLLAVVGGSTGAGKSTIVNALVGSPVTRAGVIRPTTRQPILVHAPSDAGWFATDRILPGLARVRGRLAEPGETAETAGETPDASRIGELVLLPHERVPASLAILDAPDIDSIADENRALAAQLLAAADLWLFVTTASRYADAVPWRLLDDAASRSITVGVVLNRVPPGAEADVREDLGRMLESRGLSGARVFTLTEQALTAEGMLPQAAVAEVREWLEAISGDHAERSRIAAATLAGAVTDLAHRVDRIATARAAQLAWVDEAEAAVRLEYSSADAGIDAATQDGALLRGEVLSRWQDFVGTSDVFRTVESWFSRTRDSVTAWFRGVPAPVTEVETTIEHGLHAVIVDQAARAAAGAWRELQRSAAGRELVAGHPSLSAPSAGFERAASAMIREWQGAVLQLVSDNVGSKRTRARVLSLGLNAVTVALMVVVFASTGGLTGGELVIAGGSAVVGQKLLETIFGEDAVRRLAKSARDDLGHRVDDLLAAEARRFEDLLAAVRRGSTPDGLRTAAADLVAAVEEERA